MNIPSHVEAERIWPQVLEDARHGNLKRRYDGGLAEIGDVPLPLPVMICCLRDMRLERFRPLAAAP